MISPLVYNGETIRLRYNFQSKDGVLSTSFVSSFFFVNLFSSYAINKLIVYFVNLKRIFWFVLNHK